MQERQVQLMLYGADVGAMIPNIVYDGINMLSFSCPENRNYLFVDIVINSQTIPGQFTIHLKHKDGRTLQYEFTLQRRSQGSADRKGHSAEDVIYLITPDRFSNGTLANDTISGMKETINRADKNGRHGGDIEGVLQQLNYLQALGVTALWLNPFLENNMPQWSYHGYAITDFYKSDPRIATNDQVRELTQSANEKGIKIIMDMIHNHCGLSHWWMNDLPTTDWINFNNQPYIQTNHQKTLHPDPYEASEDLSLLEDGWFVPTMPDLNVRNPYLANYLITNSLWWIEYAGLSGIRMDTYLYPESGFMADWTKRVMKEYPNFNITGEVWFDQPAFVSYWQRGKINHDGYISHLPSLFDFPLHSAMIKSLTTTETWGSGWVYLYEMLAQDFQYPDPNNLVTFVDNHDMSRIYAQLDGDIAKIKMALAFTMTMRGIPQLYYGTEILMTSPVTRDDGLVRSDFPGGWPGDSINAFTDTGLTSAQRDMKSYITNLLNWRKTASVVHEGKTTHYIPEKGVYVIFRYTETDTLMLILNKNPEPTTLDLQRFSRMIGKASVAHEVITNQTIALRTTLELKGPGPIILAFK